MRHHRKCNIKEEDRHTGSMTHHDPAAAKGLLACAPEMAAAALAKGSSPPRPASNLRKRVPNREGLGGAASGLGVVCSGAPGGSMTRKPWPCSARATRSSRSPSSHAAPESSTMRTMPSRQHLECDPEAVCALKQLPCQSSRLLFSHPWPREGPGPVQRLMRCLTLKRRRCDAGLNTCTELPGKRGARALARHEPECLLRQGVPR